MYWYGSCFGKCPTTLRTMLIRAFHFTRLIELPSCWTTRCLSANTATSDSMRSGCAKPSQDGHCNLLAPDVTGLIRRPPKFRMLADSMLGFSINFLIAALQANTASASTVDRVQLTEWEQARGNLRRLPEGFDNWWSTRAQEFPSPEALEPRARRPSDTWNGMSQSARQTCLRNTWPSKVSRPRS